MSTDICPNRRDKTHKWRLIDSYINPGSASHRLPAEKVAEYMCWYCCKTKTITIELDHN